MKILYIHQHFTFPSGVGGARSYYFAKKLVEEGHSVAMLCGGIEGSDTGVLSSQLISEAIREGIKVIKVNVPYSNKQSFFKRILSFMKFILVASKVVLTEKYDLIYATSTPLTVGVLPLLAKLLRRKKYIFEVRDLWPEVPEALGIIKNKFLLKLLYGFEKLIYRFSECCIGLSPGMVEGIKSVVPKKTVYLLPNACDNVFFSDVVSKSVKLSNVLVKKSGEFWLGFTGAHGTANGLDAVLDVAKIIREKGYNNIKFIFVGDGNKKSDLVTRAAKEKLTNCVFSGSMPKPDLKSIYSQLDVGLMILMNNETFQEGSSPNKFFDYIACGLPVIVNYPGWMSRVIKYFQIGVTVHPDAPEAFASEIVNLVESPRILQTMSDNTSKARSAFDRDDVAQSLIQIVGSDHQDDYCIDTVDRYSYLLCQQVER
jgi:glycosyltransferase involved in cell wall biosynthesis